MGSFTSLRWLLGTLVCTSLVVVLGVALLGAGPGVTVVKWKYATLTEANFSGGKSHWVYSEKLGVQIAKDADRPEALNAMGDAGWELVTVERREDSLKQSIYIFKKQN